MIGLLLLGIWSLAGLGVMWWGGRAGRAGYRRRVSSQVLTVGDEFRVMVELTPPRKAASVRPVDLVLAIDHSGSMGSAPGSRLADALRAAESFVQSLPPSVQVGIVQFDHEAQILGDLGVSRLRARSLLKEIAGGGGTAIDLALVAAGQALASSRPGASRTVALFTDGGSDPVAARAAADALKGLTDPPTIVCLGFGPCAQGDLLEELASEPDLYLQATDDADLHTLFGRLGSVVAGPLATSGVIDEGVESPRPFDWVRSIGSHPYGMQPGPPVRAVWGATVVGDGNVQIEYQLRAECQGWWPVVADAGVSWKTAGEAASRTEGPSGPKVLVLSPWLRWAWPIFNPIFWMIFGRFVPCSPAPQPHKLEHPVPLPPPSFPEPPPAPAHTAHIPEPVPSLILGLGSLGSAVAARVKHRAWDRGVAQQLVTVRSIRVTSAGPPVDGAPGSAPLDPNEVVSIQDDLRPYVESLREGPVPALRSWVPWYPWLLGSRPLSTVQSIDDRRKARLFLLRGAADLEESIGPHLERIREQQGLVIVVASAFDAEGSGLLSEVAHICAAHGSGVTAVLAGGAPEVQDLGRYALAQEMERLLELRRSPVYSDRTEPPTMAKQLFDRVVVLDRPAEEPVAEMVWHFITSAQLRAELPAGGGEGEPSRAFAASLTSQAYPVFSLWRWVREHTLANEINGRWLGLREVEGRFVIPPSSDESVGEAQQSFWSGSFMADAVPGPLITGLGRLVSAGRAGAATALLDLEPDFPVHSPYHEQKAYYDEQVAHVRCYTAAWADWLLRSQAEEESWGLPLLAAAVRSVEQSAEEVLEGVRRLQGNAEFREVVLYAQALFSDVMTEFADVRSDVDAWIRAFAGPLGGSGLPDGLPPHCYEIDEARLDADSALEVDDVARRVLATKFSEWLEQFGASLLDQVRFCAHVDPIRTQVFVRLSIGNDSLESPEFALERMRALLDGYRSATVMWPTAWMGQKQIAFPERHRLMGADASSLFPSVGQTIDASDPQSYAAIRIEESTIRVCLDAQFPPQARPLPFTWPEETHATRLAGRVRNELNTEPSRFTALGVHLLRDPRRFYAFLADLAEERVSQGRGGFVLERGGQRFAIGPEPTGIVGLEAFQVVAHQVVSLAVSSDGEPIPDVESITWRPHAPTEAVAQLEAHPLVREASHDPQWAAWLAIVTGLVLEFRSIED